jgi:hypothetical protein
MLKQNTGHGTCGYRSSPIAYEVVYIINPTNCLLVHYLLHWLLTHYVNFFSDLFESLNAVRAIESVPILERTCVIDSPLTECGSLWCTAADIESVKQPTGEPISHFDPEKNVFGTYRGRQRWPSKGALRRSFRCARHGVPSNRGKAVLILRSRTIR